MSPDNSQRSPRTISRGTIGNRGRINSGERGNGYTAREIDVLVELLESVFPIARTEWDYVHRTREGRFHGYGRTVESLRRKFSEIYCKNVSTGDPPCSPHV